MESNEMKYEANERERERETRYVCDEMGIANQPEGLDKPFVREFCEQGDGEILPGEAARFRAMVATAN